MDLLYKLHKQRWSWAIQGIAEFRSELGLGDTATGDKRVMIGVYGPTQVGKTTLILRILGIDDKYLAPLSSALRGSRVIGNSATVTTTNYRQSEDDTFLVEFPDGQTKTCKDLQQLQVIMSELRASVESAGDYPTRPVTIRLARYLFNHDLLAKRKQSIEILDLPGDDSKEDREIDHVDRCLKQYLPHCTVCILMEISSQILSLTQMTQENVRHWPWQPSKFRIVLTRAVSDSSMNRRIGLDEFPTAAAFRNAFLEELRKTLVENKECTIGIFPLEFGDSWNDLRKRDERLFSKAKPLIEGIFEQLIDDLSTVYSAKNEVVQMLDVDGFVEKRHRDKTAKLSEDLLKTNQDIDCKLEAMKVLAVQIKKMSEAIEETKEHIKQLKSMKIGKPSVMTFPVWSDRPWSQCKVSSLRIEFGLATDALATEYGKRLDKWNKSMHMIVNRYEYEITFKTLKYHFEPPPFGVSGWDQYFLESSFNKDLYRCRYDLQEANDEAYEQLTSLFNKSKKDILKKLNAKIKVMNYEIQTFREDLEKTEKYLLTLRNDAECIREKIVLSGNKWEQDQRRMAHRKLYMRKSFMEQFRHYHNQILSPYVPAAEKWVYHQYLNLMSEDMRWVENYEFKGEPETEGS